MLRLRLWKSPLFLEQFKTIQYITVFSIYLNSLSPRLSALSSDTWILAMGCRLRVPLVAYRCELLATQSWFSWGALKTTIFHARSTSASNISLDNSQRQQAERACTANGECDKQLKWMRGRRRVWSSVELPLSCKFKATKMTANKQSG